MKEKERGKKGETEKEGESASDQMVCRGAGVLPSLPLSAGQLLTTTYSAASQNALLTLSAVKESVVLQCIAAAMNLTMRQGVYSV